MWTFKANLKPKILQKPVAWRESVTLRVRGYGFEPSLHRNGIRCLSAWRSASMAGLQCVTISGTKHKGSAGLNNSSKKKVAKMSHTFFFQSRSTELFVPECKCHIHISCNTLKSSSPTHYTAFPAARQHFPPLTQRARPRRRQREALQVSGSVDTLSSSCHSIAHCTAGAHLDHSGLGVHIWTILKSVFM